MSFIKEFNHRLNKSVKWQSSKHDTYLSQINTMLRSTIQSMTTTESVCLIGVGRCRDVSLTLFLDAFNHIIVTDIDSDAVQDCVGNRRNITMEILEYTGFDEAQFFERFPERMWAAKTTEDIDQFLSETIEIASQYQFLEQYQGTIDMVYVSPIYTQLLYQQCVNELIGLRKDGYSSVLADHMQRRMLEEMPGVIERFNRNLRRLLRDDGILFVLSDVFELEPGTDFYRKVSNSIKSPVVMDEIYHNYQSQYGYGLGDYGLYDASTIMTIRKKRWLLWEFGTTRSFAIHLNIFQNLSTGGTT